MKIVFFGTPGFAVPILKRLAGRHEIAAVVTQPDRPKNRGHRLMYSEVKEEALKMGVEILQPLNIKKADIPNADVYIVVAYGQIFPERLLQAPKYGCLNVHASLLPKYRGAAPIQRAIEEGESVSGVSIMRMEKGLDTGDIILSEVVEIGERNSAELSEVLSEVGAKLMLEALERIEAGTAEYRKQGADFTYARMITKTDFELNPSGTCLQNCLKIRAFGYIKTWIDGKNVKIFKLECIERDSENRNERLERKIAEIECAGKGNEGKGNEKDNPVFIDNEHILVRFSDCWAQVLELQPENSKRMLTKSYLIGRR